MWVTARNSKTAAAKIVTSIPIFTYTINIDAETVLETLGERGKRRKLQMFFVI